ncbi:hypothetical protein BJV74DRAFT_857961 [Russula compacta]|nr:hypothetical protein BJV74DRAFT_857961 [Russula compacta]
MGDQSSPSDFVLLFEAALQDYERQTGKKLVDHPLLEQLQNCDSVDSVIAVLQQQAQAFSEFRGSDKIMKSLKATVSILCKLSTFADLGEAVTLSFPPVNAILAGFVILLAAVKGVNYGHDGLVELLESIEHYLRRLDIYTKMPPTTALNEIVMKIMVVELLSILALATKQIQQGRPKKCFKKFYGEKGVEAVLQRLDRLTQEEARMTVPQTLEIVYGLVQNTRVVMDDGKASVDSIRDALGTVFLATTS